jgi:general stress protein 26
MSLSGTAEIIRDREILRALWTETIRPWFPQGQDDPELCMIRVIPTVGEYWDYSGVGQRLSFAWELAKSYVKGEKVKDESGDHQKVKLQATS